MRSSQTVGALYQFQFLGGAAASDKFFVFGPAINTEYLHVSKQRLPLLSDIQLDSTGVQRENPLSHEWHSPRYGPRDKLRVIDVVFNKILMFWLKNESYHLSTKLKH